MSYQIRARRAKSAVDSIITLPKCKCHPDCPLYFVCVDQRCSKAKQIELMCQKCQQSNVHGQKDHQVKCLSMLVQELQEKVQDVQLGETNRPKDEIETKFEKIVQEIDELSVKCNEMKDKVNDSLNTYINFKKTENIYKEEIQKVLSQFSPFNTENELRQIIQEVSNYTYVDQRSLKINGQVSQRALEKMKENAFSYCQMIHEKFSKINEEVAQAMQQKELATPKQYRNRPERLHYIMCLDSSGSMSHDPWNQLISSVQQFLGQIKHLDDDKVSFLVYDNTCRIQVERERISEDLINKIKYRGGVGTNFIPLFSDIVKLVDKYKDEDRFVIVFMSDGSGKFPESQIAALQSQFCNSVYKFFTIAFGALTQETFKDLCCINTAMKGRFKNPISYKQLKLCYQALAKAIASWDRIV